MKRKWFLRALPAALAAAILTAAAPMNAAALLTPNVSTVKPWDQLQINEQYSEFAREAGAYSVQSVELTAGQVGDAVGSVTAVGMDNRMNRFTHSAQIYQINGIATACAVAVKYSGDDRYFVSTNRDYTPATLGKLIEDLSLEENLVCGNISYTYWKDNVQKKGNHITEKYTLDDAATVWDMLLGDKSLPVTKEAPNPLVGVMEISVGVNVIGAQDATLSVTSDGYLKMYVLGSGKVFYPGKEVTQKFIQYITDNCERTGRTAAGDDGPADGSSLLGAKSVLK